MKWDTLKKKVAEGLYSHIRYGGNSEANLWALLGQVDPSTRMTLSEMQEKYGTTNRHFAHLVRLADMAYERIMQWDVRCVGQLRELFPQYFPQSLRTGNLVAYIEDSPDSPWVVEKAT